MIAGATLTERHSWWTLGAILTVVLLPCLPVRATRASDSAEDSQPAAESASSKTPPATPEPAAVEPKEPAAVFPHIKPVYRKSNLRHIESYCKQRGVRQINRDRVRLFVQPMGIVSKVIEVDLARRELTVYPGTLSKKKIVRTPLDERQTARIRALVTSDEFKKTPRENKKMGRDGTSYLVEVSIGDAYSWKLHWVPDNKDFMKVISHIRALPKGH